MTWFDSSKLELVTNNLQCELSCNLSGAKKKTKNVLTPLMTKHSIKIAFFAFEIKALLKTFAFTISRKVIDVLEIAPCMQVNK